MDSFLIAGVIGIILVLLNVLRKVIYPKNSSFFWFCDLALILLSIGFFTKNFYLIKAVINIGLISQILFILDLSMFYFFKISPLNVGRETSQHKKFARVVRILIHLTIPISFLLTYRFAPNILVLIYSMTLLIGVYCLTLLFTEREENVNYVFSNKFLFKWEIPLYTHLWIILTFFILIIPTQFIQYIIYTLFK